MPAPRRRFKAKLARKLMVKGLVRRAMMGALAKKARVRARLLGGGRLMGGGGRARLMGGRRVRGFR